jgi:tetratricopeptide (TPR) repeat protein
VIERLLAAEQALAEGRLEVAETLFRQVADADARNAIAVVGLGRVAQVRGDRGTAAALAERALIIDPEDAAALRLRDETAAVQRAGRAAGGTMSPSEAIAAGARPSFVARLSAWLRRLLGRDRRSGG